MPRAAPVMYHFWPCRCRRWRDVTARFPERTARARECVLYARNVPPKEKQAYVRCEICELGASRRTCAWDCRSHAVQSGRDAADSFDAGLHALSIHTPATTKLLMAVTVCRTKCRTKYSTYSSAVPAAGRGRREPLPCTVLSNHHPLGSRLPGREGSALRPADRPSPRLSLDVLGVPAQRSTVDTVQAHLSTVSSRLALI